MTELVRTQVAAVQGETCHAVCRLMLDPEEREEFDFVALNTAVIECKHIAKQTQNPRDSESAELLTSVASSAQQRTLEFGKLFREKSGDASTLPFKSVVRSCSHLSNWSSLFAWSSSTSLLSSSM